jgi:hypothetical protein
VVATRTAIRLFRDADEALQWAGQAGRSGGEVVPATTIWELSTPWSGDRLAPDFTPHSSRHNQALLREVGLRGAFWQLP